MSTVSHSQAALDDFADRAAQFTLLQIGDRVHTRVNNGATVVCIFVDEKEGRQVVVRRWVRAGFGYAFQVLSEIDFTDGAWRAVRKRGGRR